MKGLSLYRIFSYILFFMAIYNSFSILAMLLVALSNPTLLLQVFLAATIIMYTISSFIFLRKGIDSGNKLKAGLKDFIKVNAFVTAALSVLMIVVGFVIILMPESLLKQMISMMPEVTTIIKKTPAEMYTTFRMLSWLMLIYGVCYLTHIRFTFRLLKQYAHLFVTQNQSNQF